jgi:hypothetical protein
MIVREIFGEFLDGKTTFGGLEARSLVELLKMPGTQITMADDVLQAEPCKKLMVTSPEYRAEVWFAPGKSFQCTRFSVEHGPRIGLDDENGRPLKRYRRSLDSVGFREIGCRCQDVL